MFGYIRTDTPEMKVRETEYYRAVYCGLCRAQGKCTGQCSRLTLSYDVAFLATVRMAVCGYTPEFDRKRCIAHPFSKRLYVKSNPHLDACACAAAILTFGKCLDDIADERGVKRARAIFLKPFFASMRKKALKRSSFEDAQYVRSLSDADGSVKEKLTLLSALEKEGVRSADKPAEIFGLLMADISAVGLEGNEARIMRNIGKHLGRWVYMIDAADDISEDMKRQRFNPFLNLYGGRFPTEEEKLDISYALRLELDAATPAFDLIDYGDRTDLEGIINNVIYRGMPKTADRILGVGDGCDCNKDSDRRNKRNKKKSKG